MPTPNVEHIPAALRAFPQWVCWKKVVRDGKETKCPFDPKTGHAARATEPRDWASFEAACAAAQAPERYDGIGFVFKAGGGICGIDLDDCIDAATGGMKVWGRELLARLDSYAEISPSGLGVKVFLLGKKPGPRCKKPYADGAVELYDRDRFFTVTGQRLDATSPDVEARQDKIRQVYEQIFGPETEAQPPLPAIETPSPEGVVALADEEIIALAGQGKHGQKFKELWAGNWNAYFNSASEADSSLVFKLAYFTKDAAQIDRLYRRSRMMREKWDQTHGHDTYGALTINKALLLVTGQYRPKRWKAKPAQAARSVASGQMIPLGQRDPATNRLVLSPRMTLPTAEAYMREFHAHAEGRTLHHYAGLLLHWLDNRYSIIEDKTLKHRLQPWLHRALRYVYNQDTRTYELRDFESNPATINAAFDSISTYVHLPADIAQPSWLGGQYKRADPQEILACKSLNLHIPTETVIPSTPAFFSMHALEFDYTPDPPAPARWIEFLEELFGEDEEAIQLLQEWFGYCLTPDTSQQKMLLLVGPKRCGKGTMARVLQNLIGTGNVCGPTISGLASGFGLQPLIGKTLAIVSDARFAGENLSTVVERLLCISGEDALTVDRKHKDAVTLRLNTRLMFLTNELPRLADASGALAGRFLILPFTRSFYGQEDKQLTGKLIRELPGILLWALAGWRRLRARGFFVQPRSALPAVEDLEDLTSPVGAFVRQRCLIGAECRVAVDQLYNAWAQWCTEEGWHSPGTKATFGRDLAAAIPGMTKRRNRESGMFYEGIELNASLGGS